MYLYYQKLEGVTEFLLSSDGRTNFLNWKNASSKKEANFIIHTFKQVPIQNWIFEDKTKIWSIIGSAGAVLLAHFESFTTQGILKYYKLSEITDDLRGRLERGDLSKPLSKSKEELKFNEEEFFYAPAGRNSELDPDQVLTKLALLLEESEDFIANSDEQALKSLYRKAARRFHPDRNSGDGSKMSELNMLWNIFNAGVKI